MVHRIHLVTVGKIKTSWIKEGCDLYTERLSHLCDFRPKVLTAGRSEEEDERIQAAVEKAEGKVVLLDERGREMDSTQFAGWLGLHRDRGQTVTFVIGGAYGFSDALRAKKLDSIALSSMTFTHELAQLVFVEQLYRAHGILAGSGYHH
jgi:23S rRNA (pseudouridine1915-N3)-methyltransferase